MTGLETSKRNVDGKGKNPDTVLQLQTNFVHVVVMNVEWSISFRRLHLVFFFFFGFFCFFFFWVFLNILSL